MARKSNKGRKPAELPEEAARNRVIQFVKTVHAGNQNQAARSLGVSQSVLSRVINSQRPPTPALLEAIAGQHGISARWALEGEEEMFLPSTKGTLPVARSLLPGAPADFPQFLTGERRPVIPDNERASRYYAPIVSGSPLTKLTQLRFAAGDFLLIETARDHLDRLDLIDRSICVVASESEPLTDLQFAMVSIDGGECWAKRLAGNAVATDVTNSSVKKRKVRKVIRDPEADTKRRMKAKQEIEAKRETEAPEKEPSHSDFKIEDPSQLVGVVISMDRPAIMVP